MNKKWYASNYNHTKHFSSVSYVNDKRQLENDIDRPKMGIIEEFQNAVLPVIIFFGVVNVVGFLGNLLVMYVFTFRYEKNVYRKLVLSLCFVDLLNCCTTVPMETTLTWLWFNSPSTALCKVKNFFVQFSGLSAMYLLFLAAVYNYRRICRRDRWQLSESLGDLVLIGLAMSLVFAFPAPILWDVTNRTIEIENQTQTLLICEVHIHYHETFYPMLYRNIISVYDVFLLATIVLYILVARRIIQDNRIKQRRTNSPQREISTSVFSDDEAAAEQDYTTEEETSLKKGPETRKEEKHRADKENTPLISPRIRNLPAESRGKTVQPPVRRFKLSPTRKAVIMAILSGAFAVTFIMGLSFGYVFALRDYSDYKSLREIVVLFACYRVYFANYALNPIVYLILDRCFRREVCRMLSAARCKCSKQ